MIPSCSPWGGCTFKYWSDVIVRKPVDSSGTLVLLFLVQFEKLDLFWLNFHILPSIPSYYGLKWKQIYEKWLFGLEWGCLSQGICCGCSRWNCSLCPSIGPLTLISVLLPPKYNPNYSPDIMWSCYCVFLMSKSLLIVFSDWFYR